MVGHGVRSVIGAVDHHDAPFSRRLDVDGVGADAVFDDAFKLRRRLDHLGRYIGVTGEDDIGVTGRLGQFVLGIAFRRHHVRDRAQFIQVLFDDLKLGVGTEDLGFHARPSGMSRVWASITDNGREKELA